MDLARKTEQARSRYNASVEAGDTEVSAELGGTLAGFEAEKAGAQQALAQQYPDYVARYLPRPPLGSSNKPPVS